MHEAPEKVTAATLSVMGAFQALLAAGAPWGALSWGGTYRGRLPSRLRAVSGAAAVGYLATARFIAGGHGSQDARSRTFTAVSAVMGLGTVANAVSRSTAERLVWTPITAVTAVLAWQARR